MEEYGPLEAGAASYYGGITSNGIHAFIILDSSGFVPRAYLQRRLFLVFKRNRLRYFSNDLRVTLPMLFLIQGKKF